MSRIKNKDYIAKWRSNLGLSFLIFFFGIWFCIVMLALIPQNKKLFLILFFIGFGVNIIFLIYGNVFGFNKLIYFDNEKVFCKKKYEWRWDEVTQVDIICVPLRMPMSIIKITTNPKTQKLYFCIYSTRYKKLLAICPNDKVKNKLKDYFEA